MTASRILGQLVPETCLYNNVRNFADLYKLHENLQSPPLHKVFEQPCSLVLLC